MLGVRSWWTGLTHEGHGRKDQGLDPRQHGMMHDIDGVHGVKGIAFALEQMKVVAATEPRLEGG